MYPEPTEDLTIFQYGIMMLVIGLVVGIGLGFVLAWLVL